MYSGNYCLGPAENLSSADTMGFAKYLYVCMIQITIIHVFTSQQTTDRRFEVPYLCSMQNGHLVLNGSALREGIVASRIKCAAECREDTDCTSFNYRPSTGDCQLNNGTVMRDCSNVRPARGYKHYEAVSIGPISTYKVIHIRLWVFSTLSVCKENTTIINI